MSYATVTRFAKFMWRLRALAQGAAVRTRRGR